MHHLTSSHDNTPDAREALRSRYLSSTQRRTTSASSTPSRSARQRGPATRAPRTNASPTPASLSREQYERALRSYDSPEPRPSNLALGTLWFGSEPDVEHTFFRWDGSLESAPIEAIQNAIRGFEAGDYVGTMAAETKTALVHVVTQGMFQNRLSSSHAISSQIQFFLAEAYRYIVARDSRLTVPRRGHWILGIVRDRTEELQWLKYQAERRWWCLAGRRIEEFHRQLEEPLDSEVDALFDSYTYHSELPPSPAGWN